MGKVSDKWVLKRPSEIEDSEYQTAARSPKWSVHYLAYLCSGYVLNKGNRVVGYMTMPGEEPRRGDPKYWGDKKLYLQIVRSFTEALSCDDQKKFDPPELLQVGESLDYEFPEEIISAAEGAGIRADRLKADGSARQTLDPQRENTLLKIIAGLAHDRYEFDFNMKKRSDVPGKIEGLTELLDPKVKVGRKTIRDILCQCADLLTEQGVEVPLEEKS